VLRSLVPGLQRHDVYVCGPVGMTSAAVEALQAAGVPKRHIHFESFQL
jgi:ferredoxin-NADP reductase